MSKKQQPKRSLVEYARAQRERDLKAHCAVCGLPQHIRSQIREMRELKIKQQVVLRWLKEECGITITPGQFNHHRAGLHETRFA